MPKDKEMREIPSIMLDDEDLAMRRGKQEATATATSAKEKALLRWGYYALDATK